MPDNEKAQIRLQGLLQSHASNPNSNVKATFSTSTKMAHDKTRAIEIYDSLSSPNTTNIKLKVNYEKVFSKPFQTYECIDDYDFGAVGCSWNRI